MDREKMDGVEPQGLPITDQHRMRSNSIASTNFESALTKAGFGKFNYIMLLLTIPAACSSPFVTATMSYVVPVAGPDIGLTPTSKALLLSAPYAGMISSAFLWGVLSDSFGRQRLITVGFLLDFAMNTLCAVIRNLITIFIFKFLSGFMVCGPYSIFMTYLAEVFPEKRRDFAVLSTGIFACALTTAQVCMAAVIIPCQLPQWLPLKSWQMFILCSGIPSLITGIASAFCVESPKFLAEKGKTDKALQVCKKIYTINTGFLPDTYPVQVIRKPVELLGTSKKSTLEKMQAATTVLKPPFIYRLLIIFAIQIAIITSENLIRLWLPEMLTVMSNVDPAVANQTKLFCPLLAAGHKAGAEASQVTSRDEVYFNMIILNSGGLTAQFFFFFLVKYLTKKTLIMGVSGIAALSFIAIPLISSEYVFIPSSIAASVLTIAYFCQIGLIVEIFPTNIRATSVSLNLMVGRIGVLAVNFLVANLMYTYCEYMFYTLCLSCIGTIVICLFFNTTPFDSTNYNNDKQR